MAAGDLFVADGTDLVEIPSAGGQSSITSALAGSITGLVVDPSGSVFVAETGGIIRIPSESGVLTINDAVNVAQDLVTSPSGSGHGSAWQSLCLLCFQRNSLLGPGGRQRINELRAGKSVGGK
jgi:hypothetical protein